MAKAVEKSRQRAGASGAGRAKPPRGRRQETEKSLVGRFASKLDETVGFLVWDTSRAYQRVSTPVFARHGISFGWYHFMRILHERDGLTLRELAEAAHLRGPTAVQAIQELERRGFVSRAQNGSDARKVNVHLTAAGRKACEAILPLSAHVNQLGVAGLSPADQATLKRLLRHIRANMFREIDKRGAADRER